MVKREKHQMRWIYFLLLILFVYINAVNGETQSFNITLQNNTALNFESGYYIIELIGIHTQFPAFVKVNLTANGESKTFNLYENENSYLPKPYDKIDLRANNITETEATILVVFPAEWNFPEKYIIPTKVELLNIPQIVIIKSVDKTKINIGDVVEIKILVEAKGNGTAYNLTLIEELPRGFSLAPGSRFPPVIQSSLGAGERQEIYYALKAVESGIFNIEPTTVTYGSESNKSNPVTIEVAEVSEKSNLTTVISVDKDNVKTDDLVRVTIKTTNVGNASAESILIDGNIPSGLVATEGDLRHAYQKVDPKESEEYIVVLKAIEPANYSISLKTFYSDDMAGMISTSKSITVTKKEKDYLYIFIPAAIVVIGIVLFTLRRHREYSY